MPSIILSDNGVSSGSAGLKTTAASDGALALQTTTAGGTATTAVTIGTDQSVTFAQAANLPNTFGFKNRLINGGMAIDQRNAGASVTITNIAAGTYTLDRWQVYGSVTSKFSVQQNAGSVTPPAGFTNYLGTTSLSSYSVGAGEYYYLAQAVEGFNVADFGWGSANAQTVTLSFWVRSSLTGTFSGSVTNSATNRSYPFSYTVSAANTWEQKSVTIPGDTTGTWLTNNGIGAYLFFNLGSGSNVLGTANAWTGSVRVGVTGSQSIIATNGATFYITGVQLEKGSTATSFDYRPYGTELALCQRYYQQLVKGASTNLLGTATWFSAIRADGITFLPVSMRASPSFSVVTGASYYRVYLAGNSYNCSTVSFNGASSDFSKVLYYNNTDFSGMTNGSGWWEGQNASSSIGLSAEL